MMVSTFKKTNNNNKNTITTSQYLQNLITHCPTFSPLQKKQTSDGILYHYRQLLITWRQCSRKSSETCLDQITFSVPCCHGNRRGFPYYTDAESFTSDSCLVRNSCVVAHTSHTAHFFSETFKVFLVKKSQWVRLWLQHQTTCQQIIQLLRLKHVFCKGIWFSE